ncbi:zinc finger matrin-type protein 1 isoform 1-T4 [Menidia menidia]
MEDGSVCTSRNAKSDAQKNINSTPNAAISIDADTIINTKNFSPQVEGGKTDEELLKGLLTDSYCHVCCSKLLVDSHRQSHYEGKRHAQKVRVYLKAVRAEKTEGSQQTMPNDKNRFCKLCNMVFSSPVVAKSHYEGKVHAKNLRKLSLHQPNTEVLTWPRLSKGPENFDQKLSSEGDKQLHLDPVAATASLSTDTDPNKYCSLCSASFNNPQMALQHYNGRKHQRKQARQKLLNKLRDNVQQANSLMCQMCDVQLNSVEMYQAHMQGNKHQIREKKVSNLCKSQPKVYSTFADELADYIEVQKARGITPKPNQVPLQDGTPQEDGEEAERKQEALETWDLMDTKQTVPIIPCSSSLPNQPHPGTWHPSFPGPPWPAHGWDYNCSPPLPPCSGSSSFTIAPKRSERYRRLSSSSTFSTSSSTSCSFYSSHTSDSEDSEHRHREKRKVRISKRDAAEGSEREERRRKRHRTERDLDSEEGRREESLDSGEERSTKKIKSHGHQFQKEIKCQHDNFVVDRGEEPKHITEKREVKDLNLHESGHDKSARLKFKREKRKTKDKVDTRTEEEKLWDDSILGC